MSRRRSTRCIPMASTSRRVSKRRQVERIRTSCARCSRRFSLMTEFSPVFGARDPDARGYYGAYGGRFVPETLVAPVEELTAAYFRVREDAGFRNELAD